MDLRERDVRWTQGVHREERARFERLFEGEVRGVLEARGFVAVGHLWYSRVAGHRVDVMEVYESQLGGQCCIDLGCHYAFLPVRGDWPADLTRLHPSHCQFTARLAEAGNSDHWWKFGRSEAEAKAAVDEIVGLLLSRGLGFFDRFTDVGAMFGRVTQQDIEANDFARIPYPMPRAHAALLQAHVMRYLGQPEACRAFADLALRLRESDRALISKSELEELITSPQARSA